MKIMRRNFLIQALALPTVSVLFARFLAACGSNNNPSPVTCNKGFTATSDTGTNGANHTHDVTVPLADITAGTPAHTYNTSTTNGHYHQVTFTPSDYTKLGANQSGVSETTLADSNGHQHTFNITCA
jgi:hypothetical protein